MKTAELKDLDLARRIMTQAGYALSWINEKGHRLSAWSAGEFDGFAYPA